MALFAEVLEVNSVVNAADRLFPIESMHDNSGKLKFLKMLRNVKKFLIPVAARSVRIENYLTD